MSSGITPPLPLPPEAPVVASPTEYEDFIERRLRQTRRQVKRIDVAGGLVTLAIGVLGYLFAATLVDHWLIAGGLGFWGRLLLWIGLIGTAGTYFAYRLLPPLLRRINPVFAASTIEQSQPSLRNSLINFLLLRGRRQEVAAQVFQAMECRAAADLSKIRIETAVDRTHVIRLSCILAALLALFSLYLVFSPKSSLHSAVRVLWPWSVIEAPTRVTIRDVRPGDADAFHGKFVTVSAEIVGLREGESPLLVYSTTDGQIVDQIIPMTLPEGGYRHRCRLPPGNLGLQQDYEYFLAAGDYRSRRYRIAVRVAPAIAVDRVSYHYPAYTGLLDQTVERQGDLRAIEGTEVTLHAVANTEIKPGTAKIDLGCTGRRGLRMTVEGRTASGRFTLRPRSPDDASRPKYECYQLRFADLQGRENLQPIRHRIEVLRDLPPEVQFVEPQAEETQVAKGGRLAIKLRAEDPDFALRRVTLRAERDGRSLSIAPLLEKRKPEKPWPGEFLGTYTFEPVKLGLKGGDRVRYWVEAEDNKEPVPNRSATDRRWITVVAGEAAGGSGAEDKAATDGRAGETTNGSGADDKAATGGRADGTTSESGAEDKAATDSRDEDKAGKTASGSGAEGEQRTGQSEKPNERIDPEAAPGDAIQEILNDRRKNQQEQQEQQSADKLESGNQPQSGRQQQSGEQPSRADASNGRKPDSENAPGEKSSTEKPDAEKSDNDKVDAKKGMGEQPGGEKQAAEESEKSGREQGSGEQPGSQEQSRKTPAQEGPGAEADGGEKSGSTTGGKKQKQKQETPADDRSSDQKKPGEQQPGEKQSPGAGRKAGEETGSPVPQEENRQHQQEKPGQADQAPDERKGEEAKSPGTSKKQSDSKGETAGDRSGGGQQGGGQRADKSGVGSPGSHTPADEGGSQANERGEGEVGNRPDGQTQSKKSTGGAGETASGSRAGDKTATGDRAGAGEKKPGGQNAKGKPTDRDDSAKRGTPQKKLADGAAPGNGTSEGPSARGSGDPTVGGKPRTDAAPPKPVESLADKANLRYARAQTELALEHLRDQLAKEKPKLLDRLGWSKDDARRFLQRWEEMKRAAARKGSAGEAAKKRFHDALRSLGLRPRGVELRRGGVAPERLENLRDAGRFAPPPDWADQFRAYTRGVAGGKRVESGE